MLQHDLYDVLVKLQTLMSGKFTAPPEETASRLTCLVAEICTIQLEAQDIHEGVSRDGPSQQQSSERSSEHRKAVPVLSEKARQNTAADGSQHESADHAQTVARLGELILQALRSFPQAADREPALKPSSSPKASQRPRAPHGTELISDPIGTVQRRSAVSADKPQGIQQTPANEPKEIQLADSAASAARSEGASPLTAEPQAVPELTLSRWNPDSEAANAHASNSLARQLAPAAHDGLSHLEANDSPSMQRPGVRLDAGRSYHQGPSLLQSLRMSGTSFRKITSRPADSPAYSHLADQSDTETHQSGRLMRSRVPTSALHGSTVSAQQHGEEQRVSEQADLVWDGSITRVIDPEAVVRTRSGLRLRMPGRQPPAEMERPTTAGSLRPMTAVTAAGSARSFSRHAFFYNLSRAQSDRQSRGSRRPDWDDRFILPQQHKGRGREESAAPMHTYRASTPDRVLQEGLPRRKQQHPWLSKRAVQLRGALKPPSSRRAASAPRAAESRMGSPPHMASVSRAAVQLPDSCRPPGAFGHSRGAEFAEPSRLRTEGDLEKGGEEKEARAHPLLNESMVRVAHSSV
ncbi:hypothetical protein COCSUDRAFT_61950 [Coccomyxa subellipsoidea C-169]|uniref:Uncharacterized protein n=1 Tax=Coccomyxa subellipsoidea (strain C-169) TaxID=574566 RepID=I0Z1K0_COCSC|nr:hypothetical protein COCSUDRAFT_61950 [Coccomyxa subellipsoidea C-169]EIE24519.1 hypothetical protein COCSUDRAFT_61950 [Coccomyxa subellipsoidea C-169]|eukprot:XP_005649063.1 hypothetical protein COCSUDRAFT_61950 [Coccomyxa subellipsoidea C-169]